MSKPPLRKVIASQTGFCLLLAAITGVIWQYAEARALLMGGMTIVLANAWYLWRMRAIELGQGSDYVLAAYYRAEIGKILFLALLLGIMLTARNYVNTEAIKPGLNMKAFFAGFLLSSVFVTLTNTLELKRWLAQQNDQP